MLGVATLTLAALSTLSPPAGPANETTVDTDPAGGRIALDPFTSTASDVRQQKAAGRVVYCQLRGVWEPHQPDAARFPADLIGHRGPGGGWWLDLRGWPVLAPIMDDRLGLCVAKEFDAVALLDLGDLSSGFPLTDTVRDGYARALSTLADRHGLTVWVNPPWFAGGAAVGSAGTSTTTGS